MRQPTDPNPMGCILLIVLLVGIVTTSGDYLSHFWQTRHFHNSDLANYAKIIKESKYTTDTPSHLPLKGLFLALKPDGKIHDLHYRLTSDLRAKSPDAMDAILIVINSSEKVGIYTSNITRDN